MKKNLKKIHFNTKTKSHVQHKLSEEKADYIATNFSTVVLQHLNKSAKDKQAGLMVLIEHASGNHEKCLSSHESWYRCHSQLSTISPSKTNLITLDIDKLKETFARFASLDFCNHLTLGLTQNANESLHNTI